MATPSYIQKSQGTWLQLVPGDEFVAGSDNFMTSSTFADIATLTFNAPQDGDYLIVGGLSCYIDTVDKKAEFRLDVNGTPVQDRIQRAWAAGTTGERLRQNFLYKAAGLSAGSNTVKIQGRSVDGSTTIGWLHVRLYALRFDSFEDADYSEDGTSISTGISPAYNTQHAWTYATPATTSGDYLCIALLNGAPGSHVSKQAWAELLVGGTLKREQWYKSKRVPACWSTLYCEVLSLSASTTFLVQASKTAGGFPSPVFAKTDSAFFCARIPASRRILSVAGQGGSPYKALIAG